MRLPSLRNLQVFEAAARHQSFREAADALFLTHGAVGKQIKALETELGVELFARIGRRVVLTSHGRRLLIAMSEALERISETVGELQQESRHPADRLPVTVVPSFATRWLLPRLKDFHERHPEVTVELVPTVATLDLSAKHIPLGIRMGQGSWSGLEAERLTTEELFPVAAPDGIEGFATLPGSVHDMLSYPLLNPYDEWERWFKTCRHQDAGVRARTDLSRRLAVATGGRGTQGRRARQEMAGHGRDSGRTAGTLAGTGNANDPCLFPGASQGTSVAGRGPGFRLLDQASNTAVSGRISRVRILIEQLTPSPRRLAASSGLRQATRQAQRHWHDQPGQKS